MSYENRKMYRVGFSSYYGENMCLDMEEHEILGERAGTFNGERLHELHSGYTGSWVRASEFGLTPEEAFEKFMEAQRRLLIPPPKPAGCVDETRSH